ncbi:MAG: hypothetical protein FJW31_26180 [Acidobacteria bacterium]|nr:hypothetical protein [Acidobacteriota bacterium]
MIRRVNCLLLLAALLPAADTAHSIRIARIRSHMAETLRQMPNYTCTQTIERTMRRARSRRFELIDTVRLGVALVNGRELFDWPGSGKFDDREIGELLAGGTSGNGNFANHARAIFLGDAARFSYLGEQETEEHRVFRYQFVVPRQVSGYRLKVGTAEGVAGYHGFFEANTTTLDVMALDVIAGEIPKDLPLRAAMTRMRYQRVPIGAHEFLLPHFSDMSLTDLGGNDSRNVVHLAGCRQYGTESTISFADPPPETAAPTPPPPPVAAAAPLTVGLPDGLYLETALNLPLKLAGVAVGDLVEGQVKSDAKHRGAVMVPKGSVARSRIVAYRRYYDPQRTVAVTILLNELDLPGDRIAVHGTVARIASLEPSTTSRLSVDNEKIVFVSSQRRSEFPRGTRVTWQLKRKTETR